MAKRRPRSFCAGSVTDFALDDEDMDAIGRMDTGRSLILDLSDPAEVDRLHGIRFIQ